MFPEEEAELSTQDRTRLHVNLGRNEEGEIMTIRLQGALSDYFEWVGYEDAMVALNMIERGQGDWSEVIQSMAQAPVKKIVNGLSPVFKIPYELSSGKSTFPSVFEQRTIRDTTRHLLKTFSLENEYDWLTGRPNAGYLKSWKKSIIYTRNVDQINYYDIKDLVNRFLEEKGEQRDGFTSSTKSRAMVDLKLALRYDDKNAIKKAKSRLRELFSSDSTMNKYMKNNLARLNPISSLKNEWKGEFYDGLSAQDKKKFESSMKYYTDVLNPDANYEDELMLIELKILQGKIESDNYTKGDREKLNTIAIDAYRRKLITKTMRRKLAKLYRGSYK